MVAAFGIEAHLLEGQTDLPSNVLSLVQRGDIEIGAPIHRLECGKPVFIQFEEIEFAFGSHPELIPLQGGFLHRFCKQGAPITFERRSVRPLDGAEEANHPALGRSPREDGESGCVGKEEQVTLIDLQKTLYRRCIEGDAGGKSPTQFIG